MNDHLVDKERLRAELARMKDLIKTDPAVFARFDTDGNGVIDGQEWEAVRQLVMNRLRTEAAERELAKQLYEQLDDEQAAELARLEADIAAEEKAAEEQPRQSKSESKGRDFSNVELAFDPREDRRAQQQSLADEVYEREVAGRMSAVAHHNVRLSEEGTMADRRELILEQGGGAKQFFGNMFRREYVVRDAHGDELGRIGQRENEMLQNFTDYSILEDPDLNFAVYDEVADEQFEMKRTSGLSDNSIAVYNPRNRIIAQTSWSLSFLRRKYEVRAVKQGVSYWVRRRLLRPWTFDVLDPFEEPIGTMQRGWSGFGFLAGANLFHIEVEKDVEPDIMWGFLATALLADLDSERHSRRAGLDLFNN